MCEFLKVENYTKGSCIGKGSFGIVYKIADNKTGEILAAKCFMNLAEPDYVNKLDFRREIYLLSQLKHPSVIKYIGYSPTNFEGLNFSVIVTEYLPNGTLKQILEQLHRSNPPEKWSETKTLINIFGVASAMSYLHANNVLHRDLKPENILEDEHYYPKVTDFGLSKIENSNSTKSSSAIKGTPVYIAPEVWKSGGQLYGKAGDVYSFGFIVYELITLKKPFYNYNKQSYYNSYELFMAISRGQRPDIDNFVSDCYRDLITKCWSEDPDERPSFDEIVETLKTNKKFINELIDENEYYEYIESIENSEKSFNIKNFKPLIFDGSIDSFNKFPIDLQQNIISGVISVVKNTNSLDILSQINDILIYLKKKISNIDSDKQYFVILTENDKLPIEEGVLQIKQIRLLQPITEYFTELHFEESFVNLLSNFDQVIFEHKNYDAVSYKYFYDLCIHFSMFAIHISNFKQKYIEIKDEYKKCIYSIHIDSSITSIADSAFKECSSLTQVTIPSSVISIGSYAFSYCSSLTQITFEIPSSLSSIGEEAFAYCSSLTQITIPSSVIYIGSEAFRECSSLTQITIPSSVTYFEHYAFFKCSSLTQITFAIPSSVTSINFNTFYECSSLTQITIPSSVTSIDEYAFSYCSSLTQITIPSSVTCIGHHAFEFCSSLTQITIPSSVIYIGYDAFRYCSSLTQITIPSSVTEINDYLFDGCSSLKEITIPSSVKSIGQLAFCGCSTLAQITIPSSVTSIGNSAFRQCSSLKKITIPSSVTDIGEGVFYLCSTLAQVTIQSSVTSIRDHTFSSCSSLTQIIIPSSVKEIGKLAFCGCSTLAQITIPSFVTSIGDIAFCRCSTLIQITIPSSVTSIGKNAFYGCLSLTQITIPSSINFGVNVFGHCDKLDKIIIYPNQEERIKYIEDTFLIYKSNSSNEQFDVLLWTKLTVITANIPQFIKIIADYTFFYCSSLTQVTIPSSVISIGSYAFKYCKSLTQITFEIPSSLTSIGEEAFAYCSSLTQITIPSSVTKVGHYIFSNCSSLKKITIPPSLNHVNWHAFYCFASVEIKPEPPNSSSLRFLPSPRLRPLKSCSPSSSLNEKSDLNIRPESPKAILPPLQKNQKNSF